MWWKQEKQKIKVRLANLEIYSAHLFLNTMIIFKKNVNGTVQACYNIIQNKHGISKAWQWHR